ncbi:MAG: hypothetical protein WCD21_03935 [Streptomyces sp.]
MCDEPTVEPIPVALEHVASAGGRVVHLCRFTLGIMPLSEHPEGSGGRLRYEGGTPA